MPAPVSSRCAAPIEVIAAAAIVLVGTLVVALHAASILRESVLAGGILSHGSWSQIVRALGAQIHQDGGVDVADVPPVPLIAGVGLLSIVWWLSGAGWISRARQVPISSALRSWGRYGWLWWFLPIAWVALDVVCSLADLAPWIVLRRTTLQISFSALAAGWLTTFVILARKPALQDTSRKSCNRIPRVVWGAMALYFVCFGAMNWLLYESLLLPHGDSAMYEEHIWNLLHGKGFRSYLDGGRLFLGEHIQVIHLLAIPLYILWPSHVLLELCQSACLALGAIPVYRIARRHTQSIRAAALLAIAYLLYFPMQYLDIAVTLKTFRPNSFEIPLFLCALNALEACRYRTFLAWLGMTLLCQEDAAMIIAPLGLWIAVRQARWAEATDRNARWRLAWFGLALAIFGVAYVVLVVKVVLPWFRGGADVHFAQYYEGLGKSSGSIVSNILNDPRLLLDKWLSAGSWLFALQLVAPLGFLSLLSPGRLAVAAPLLGVLTLSTMTNSPLHHFHAPLVAILVWSAAAGLANVDPLYAKLRAWQDRRRRAKAANSERHRIPPEDFVSNGKTLAAIQPDGSCLTIRPPSRTARAGAPLMAAAVWTVSFAFLTGVPMTFSPLGAGFWDPHSTRHWASLYVPGERARRFPAAFTLVPRDSRVASTDYIHPRFTHHARSYDYSLYVREVPDDPDYANPDYIVIDTRHPYSEIKNPQDVKEYRDHPERWELLDDKTGGYFLVFKRK